MSFLTQRTQESAFKLAEGNKQEKNRIFA